MRLTVKAHIRNIIRVLYILVSLAELRVNLNISSGLSRAGMTHLNKTQLCCVVTGTI